VAVCTVIPYAGPIFGLGPWDVGVPSPGLCTNCVHSQGSYICYKNAI
jgi:hypothetical protein